MSSRRKRQPLSIQDLERREAQRAASATPSSSRATPSASAAPSSSGRYVPPGRRGESYAPSSVAPSSSGRYVPPGRRAPQPDPDPVQIGEQPNGNIILLEVGGYTWELDPKLAANWKVLKRGNHIILSDKVVTSEQVDAWYNLVANSELTPLSEVEKVALLLEPVNASWTLRVTHLAENPELFLSRGEYLRDNPLRTGPYYTTEVPHILHGNFSIWKDRRFHRHEVQIITQSPAISAVVSTLHGAWLASGSPAKIGSEFPVEVIDWASLASHVSHVEFLTYSPVTALTIPAYRAIHGTFVSRAVYALVLYRADVPILVPNGTPIDYTSYYLGENGEEVTLTQRSVEGVPVVSLASNLPEVEHESGSNSVSAMQVFVTLVNYYMSRNSSDDVKLATLGLAADFAPATDTYIAPIMREILYDGNLRYRYGRESIVPVIDYRIAVFNLALYLPHQVFEQVTNLLKRSGFIEVTLALEGRVVIQRKSETPSLFGYSSSTVQEVLTEPRIELPETNVLEFPTIHPTSERNLATFLEFQATRGPDTSEVGAARAVVEDSLRTQSFASEHERREAARKARRREHQIRLANQFGTYSGYGRD